ncbi:hypothetical protein BBK14_33530 [Parafrankia soli]|uniref:Uncharacterized protein n=1 Tax=Parafrankia soli TaxID=2599596 RepID=A0A1S1QQR7_9ACTN|nr:hypothetical protein [Parafrankia soli]OHV34724.1 hypothetical protein BBK14_33530 [Parafrankia soli]
MIAVGSVEAPVLGEIGLEAMRRLTESTSPHVPASQRWFWAPDVQAGESTAAEPFTATATDVTAEN